MNLRCSLMLILLIGARAAAAEADVNAPTPASLPGAETFIYRETTPEPVRLHVFKPPGWQTADRRPGFVWFYGGGWLRGTPLQSAGWARRAASLGLIGVAVDYRTRDRWGTKADAAVADARLALRWLQTHADELGLDPERIVVGGSSAGGHLALWTAIATTPPALSTEEAPLFRPVALLLTAPPTDTSSATGFGGDRFTGGGDAYSPLHHLDRDFPPTLIIHGDADTTVPHRMGVALHESLRALGVTSELVTVPGGTHRFSQELSEWREKVPQLHERFLRKLKILPVRSP